ncbi:MAG: glycoside hydrolase family 2 TIM barrel-domain containing protein [Bacillota bacterium]
MKAESNFERLISVYGQELDRLCPLPEYPRPQLVRTSYLNLNGVWQYAILPENSKLTAYQGDIIVPFSPECILSEVERIVMPDDILYYKRTFTLPKDFNVGRVILHFGAVDYKAKVTVNSTVVATHKGGYLPFSADITEALIEGENTLLVKVTDPTDSGVQARGKQKLNRGGIWYTPSSGIWQTVWLESVPKQYIKNIKITPDIDKSTVNIKVMVDGDAEGTVAIFDTNKLLQISPLKNSEATINIPQVKLWSPEQPFLYDIAINVDSDTVTSYFGMRKFSIGCDAEGVQRIMLNNQPYFHNGLLDQGYTSDGLYTFASDKMIEDEIKLVKDMGFNMLRKHIKVEPLRWYYHCDKQGVLVWQDMVNGGGKANTPLNGILGQLALLFKIKAKDTNYWLTNRQSKSGRKKYYKDTEETIDLLYNSTSVCQWVLFNESWGQFDSQKVEEFARNLDNTRTFDTVSGWHDQGGGDFISLHIYFTKIFFPKDKRVQALSEFGGYGHKVAGHNFNKTHTFGYKNYKTLSDLENAYHKLYNEQISPLIPKGLSALVYTQLTDVEDEINGILTYDRKVVKLDIQKLKALNNKLKF